MEPTLPLHVRTQLGLRYMLSRLTPGSKILPERKLSTQFGVSRVTIRRVLRDLAHEGVLAIRQGSGTFLIRQIDAPGTPPGCTAGSNIIGMSVPPVANRFISRVVVGVEREASASGYGVMLSHNSDDQDLQISQITTLKDRGCSGMVVFTDGDNVNRPEYAKAVRHLIRGGTPIVLLDRYVPGTDAPSVIADTCKGCYEATEHLIASGRRRFALLRFGSAGGNSDADRYRGFCLALQDYGLDPTTVRETELGVIGHVEKARVVVKRWWDEKPYSFDALVTMEDNMAYGAYLALRDLGARVPDDVAMIGFDNLDQPEYREVGLRLTSVDPPAEEMGEHAARLLISHLGTRHTSLTAEFCREKHVVLPPRLVIRGSCGAVMA